MTISSQNFTAYANSDEEINLTLFAADGATRLNLTTATIEWVLTSIYDKTIALIEKSSETSGDMLVTDAVQGEVSVYLYGADTALLGGQPYYHEATVIIGGARTTALYGTATINKTAPALA